MMASLLSVLVGRMASGPNAAIPRLLTKAALYVAIV